MKISDGTVKDLIRIYKNKGRKQNKRTGDYTREVANETALLLEELLLQRKGIKLEGTVS